MSFWEVGARRTIKASCHKGEGFDEKLRSHRSVNNFRRTQAQQGGRTSSLRTGHVIRIRLKNFLKKYSEEVLLVPEHF